MSSLDIFKKFSFTAEELECLEKLSKMSYEDIDFSDIPPISKEELKKFRPARLRKKNLQTAV